MVSEKQQMKDKLNYQNIFVVDTFEEAEQFRYEHNDEPVEIGTAVAWDRDYHGMPGEPGPIELTRMLECFEGIYFQSDE